jgi:hypothetical protein
VISANTFTEILSIQVPTSIVKAGADADSPAFSVEFTANGLIPFAQLVVWCDGQSHVFLAQPRADKANTYVATVAAGLSRGARLTLQVEGCRRENINEAQGHDWIKKFVDVEIELAAVQYVQAVHGDSPIRIYFGIHKHMHQPYYRATEPEYWDGEIDGIFSTRRGAYTDYVADAVERYANGGLPHAGLSTSFSGSLIEQLDRCSTNGLCGGQFEAWSAHLRKALAMRTSLGNPRIDFSAFGFFHPLMPLIPHRDIVRSIRLHREIVQSSLGVEASPILFPPEAAFHVRMIPALLEAGITAVVYDSIHRFRACQSYPYAGKNEGMLPPNLAEQQNPPATDWMQLQNVWAASPISPSRLRPSWIRYEDADGHEFRIIGIPAERYLGNEDARGGFGALQYPSVLGQLYDKIVSHQLFDPLHPPFFLLHSDGDNYGGGADSYYRHNTDKLVEWLNADPRFELTSIRDYLDRFPPSSSDVIHVEPGAWSGADNGDPQFSKWFSLVEDDYSPDLNSWSVLTMLQNAVHSIEDMDPSTSQLSTAIRLLQTAETSCYWYWTGQDVWDSQVTAAANKVYSLLDAELARAMRQDRTGPTIFPAWVLPANPGGQCWSQQGLAPASSDGVLYTLVADINQVESVHVVLRHRSGETRLALENCGPYPSRTNPSRTAQLFRVKLPRSLGDVRYYLTAIDGLGNSSASALERIHLA